VAFNLAMDEYHRERMRRFFAEAEPRTAFYAWLKANPSPDTGIRRGGPAEA
jgi:hypothetical protein